MLNKKRLIIIIYKKIEQRYINERQLRWETRI